MPPALTLAIEFVIEFRLDVDVVAADRHRHRAADRARGDGHRLAIGEQELSAVSGSTAPGAPVSVTVYVIEPPSSLVEPVAVSVAVTASASSVMVVVTVAGSMTRSHIQCRPR